MSLKLLTVALVVAMVAGCASQSRYSMKHDKAPTGQFDASGVPDAVPVWEPRSPQGNRSPYTVRGKRYTIMPNAEGYKEIGTASWYGLKFHGELTSNGEIYNMYAMSAAHKSLPLPTYLRVTNLANSRSAIVRVNDRGPFHGDRIIDLSYAAAKKLGFDKLGTANVQLEAIVPGQPGAEQASGAGNTLAPFLQVAAFGSAEGAERMRRQVAAVINDVTAFVGQSVGHSGTVYRVRVGPFSSQQAAEQARQRLVQAGLGKPLIITRSLQAREH